ncbi:helix-turn-helix domain-containing protein [Psychrobacillus psychrotolerans]|uniref:helix-turn-helix domain-containing protein n=1 Tax=Psychrobacillus psychrotolerans TaxID=126156 RepID=UPI003C761DC6
MFHERLKDLREKENITREHLAKALDITYSALSKYETGKREPDFDLLQKLATYFNVTTDYLLGISEYKGLKTNSNEEEFQAWLDDPRSKILFKEFNESSEEQKEALLKMWEILKSQGKL